MQRLTAGAKSLRQASQVPPVCDQQAVHAVLYATQEKKIYIAAAVQPVSSSTHQARSRQRNLCRPLTTLASACKVAFGHSTAGAGLKACVDMYVSESTSLSPKAPKQRQLREAMSTCWHQVSHPEVTRVAASRHLVVPVAFIMIAAWPLDWLV